MACSHPRCKKGPQEQIHIREDGYVYFTMDASIPSALELFGCDPDSDCPGLKGKCACKKLQTKSEYLARCLNTWRPEQWPQHHSTSWTAERTRS